MIRYTTLDYVYQISMLQSRKKHEALEALLLFTKAYGDMFSQGNHLMAGLRPLTKKLADDVVTMRQASSSLDRRMEKRHSHITQGKEEDENNKSEDKGGLVLEGYLFKRGQNAFRTWKRRWFYLKVEERERML